MGDGYLVTRSILVDAPAADIYARIVDLHRWREWSPWEDLDPDLQRDYSGAAQGVGAQYAWSGNKKAGKGRMAIVATEAPSAVDVSVVFEKPFKSKSTSLFRLGPEGSGTRVEWAMTGTHSVFSRIAGPLKIFDKMIGKDFEKGLAHLKAASEGQTP